MTSTGDQTLQGLLKTLSRERPVLIAGPTASGKSALALEIAARHGGVIVNADASQVYDCWRILTARPSPAEEAGAPHRLYGHKSARAPYSTGHWLREVSALLEGEHRPIIVGGTGLYFTALTQGLADIPQTPEAIRAQGDAMEMQALLDALDQETRTRIDIANRARVQRAWEVQRATGRSLIEWQRQTPPAILPTAQADTVVIDTDRDWLNTRIEMRIDQMIAAGAVEEARAVQPDYDPTLPAHRAIGAPELMAHLRGEISLKEACQRINIATRQFAKRQRTWFRSKMSDWPPFSARSQQ
ncbi:tRNA dimethylallyltransferase [Roseobacter fucihabitans]|uniref:tRNA dimethylallyltransferase n=1 Tax=Roseobacter fucihabitans TaxID=1537242 RepID=A0ABZ2BV95_9RHOB|nr:tRNA (adenosine(37)-N6)-dimethylallyltransferase MiaA [Roseobacter litoralis]MBC6965757.1 tRNA dimethylallyltransferase [Roseobacter litoralis]